MDKKVKVLMVVFLFFVLLSVAATYYKYVELRDYDTYYDDYSEVESELLYE